MEEQKKRTKSPLGCLYAAAALYGAVKLMGGIWVNVLYFLTSASMAISETKSYSVGIIGGADGPTAIFVTGPVWVSYVIPALCLIVGIWGLVRRNRT